MIFVTTGTHYLPFDRLMKMISAVRDETQENIVIQSGSSEIRVRGATQQGYFPFNEIIEYLKKARLVISHAGPATIYQSLSIAGKIPLVVPRRKEYGEHVSNHQVFFAEYLEKSGRAIVVESVAELLIAVNSKRKYLIPIFPPKISPLAKKLNRYLNSLKSKPR